MRPECDSTTKTTPVEETCCIRTPFGPVTIAANERGVTRIRLCAASVGTPAPDTRARAGTPESKAVCLLRQAARELEAYFAGELQAFTLPLAPAGTEFQQSVWAALRTIPYGQTRTYGQIAAQIGRPKACRAVGMANHCNPLPIVVPCHRVVGSDGKLTGYAWGLELKERLLALERHGKREAASRRRDG